MFVSTPAACSCTAAAMPGCSSLTSADTAWCCVSALRASPPAPRLRNAPAASSCNAGPGAEPSSCRSAAIGPPACTRAAWLPARPISLPKAAIALQATLLLETSCSSPTRAVMLPSSRMAAWQPASDASTSSAEAAATKTAAMFEGLSIPTSVLIPPNWQTMAQLAALPELNFASLFAAAAWCLGSPAISSASCSCS